MEPTSETSFTPEILERLQRDYPDSEFHNLDLVAKTVTGECKHSHTIADEVVGTQEHWLCETCGLGGWRAHSSVESIL